jgi:hypothetical protein
LARAFTVFAVLTVVVVVAAFERPLVVDESARLAVLRAAVAFFAVVPAAFFAALRAVFSAAAPAPFAAAFLPPPVCVVPVARLAESLFFAAFLAVVFLAVVFLAVVFSAVVFLAVVFLADVFLADDFSADAVPSLADFLARDVLPADFVAPPRPADAVLPADVRRPTVASVSSTDLRPVVRATALVTALMAVDFFVAMIRRPSSRPELPAHAVP